jgi:hypothetical protein
MCVLSWNFNVSIDRLKSDAMFSTLLHDINIMSYNFS